MPDRLGHGQDGEAEGEGHTEQADTDHGEGGGQHGAAATTEDEPKRTEELGCEPTLQDKFFSEADFAG
jgi:hypothetical protein